MKQAIPINNLGVIQRPTHLNTRPPWALLGFMSYDAYWRSKLTSKKPLDKISTTDYCAAIH